MEIPVYFLGTSQAIPTKKRNHVAMLLKYKDESILIDCGEGTQRQFRKAGLNPCKITRILITHWHGDHILGLPGLLQTLMLSNYNKKLRIYGPKGTKKYFKKIMGMFVKVGKLDYEIKEVSKRVFETRDFTIKAERMSHGTPCLAYSFQEKDKLRVDKKKIKKLGLKGERVGKLAEGKDVEYKGKKVKSKDFTYEQKGKKISFVLDTRKSRKIEKFAENSDLLVMESTYLSRDKNLAKKYGHLTAKQAGEIARASKSDRLVLTHISQRYSKEEKELLKEAKKEFKNTQLASDLMEIEI
jgi:ribonuclease Z